MVRLLGVAAQFSLAGRAKLAAASIFIGALYRRRDVESFLIVLFIPKIALQVEVPWPNAS
jgi:hypothetical protein